MLRIHRGQVHVPRLEERADRVGARRLAAPRHVGDDAGDFRAERRDDRRAVGLVLDHLADRLRPLRAHPPHRPYLRDKVHLRRVAVEQVEVPARLHPHLSRHVVRLRRVLEREVPALDHPVEDLRQDAPVPYPLRLEHAAASRRRVLLVERAPLVFPDVRPDAPERLESEAVGVQRLAFFPVRLVPLGYRRVVHHGPPVGVLLPLRGKEASHEVVLVPARHRHQHAPARRETRIGRRGVPVPHPFPDRRRVRARPVLEGVVYRQDVRAHAGDSAADARAPVAPGMPGNLEEAGRADRTLPFRVPQAGSRENLGVGVRIHYPLHVLVQALGEAVGVGNGHERQVRVEAEAPRRETSAHELALAVPGRHRDDHARREAPFHVGVEPHETRADLPVHPPDPVRRESRDGERQQVLPRKGFRRGANRHRKPPSFPPRPPCPPGSASPAGRDHPHSPRASVPASSSSLSAPSRPACSPLSP